jgi:hypothetical protein
MDAVGEFVQGLVWQDLLVLFLALISAAIVLSLARFLSSERGIAAEAETLAIPARPAFFRLHQR